VQIYGFAVVGYLKINILSFFWRRSEEVPSAKLGVQIIVYVYLINMLHVSA
jgi:hypothetical protein